MPQSRRWLFWIVIANVVTTILHYADNILSFAQYPEPSWISPHLIDAFWFFMTPFAAAGYVLVRRGNVHLGSAALYAYAAMSLLVLGHYRYAPIHTIALRIHVFIVLEASLAVVLIAYVFVLHLRERRPVQRA
jgi:hypothetical protein